MAVGPVRARGRVVPGAAAVAALLLLPGAAQAKTPEPKLLPAPLAVAEVSASSTLAGPAREPDRYAPWQVLAPVVAQVDNPVWSTGAPQAAWCEARPDEGVGESLTIKLAGARPVKTVAVQAGFWKNARLFASNNRPTRLGLETDGGQKLSIAVPATRKEAVFKLSGKPVTTLTVRILAVQKGRMNDTCLSRITVDGLRSAVLGADAAAQASALPAALQSAMRDLATWGPGLATSLAYPFRYQDGAAGADQQWKSYDELSGACNPDDESVTAMTCPFPPKYDEGRRRPVLSLTGPGNLLVTFYHNGECWDRWHLSWQGGAWRLSAIDSESIAPPG